MNASSPQFLPVNSIYGRYRQFLQTGWQGPRMLITETERGHKQLNGFWPYWIRHLALLHPQRINFGVEINRDHVLISSDNSCVLESSSRAWASQVHPLQTVLHPMPEESAENRQVWLAAHPALLPSTLSAVELPRGARLEWEVAENDGRTRLYLRRERRCPRALSEMQALVEFRAAYACAF